MRSGLTVVAFFAATLLSSAPAFADTHGDAVKLFEEGRKQRDQGDLEKAARTFDRSIALEPSVGAYYNLGLINDQLGRPREAVDALRKSKNLAHERGDARERDAVDALGKLLDTRNYVIVNVTEDVATAPGLRITLDGDVVPKEHFNGEVFRSATSHDLVVSATGRKDLHLSVKNKQPASAILGEAAGATTPPPPPPPPPPEKSEGGWGWQKWTGVGLIGAGAVTAGIGVVVALGYYSDQEDLETRFKAECSPQVGGQRFPCNQETGNNRAKGAALKEEAESLDSGAVLRNVVVFGLAGAAIAGGIILLVTAPSSSETSAGPEHRAPAAARVRVRVAPRLAPNEQGFSLVGTF